MISFVQSTAPDNYADSSSHISKSVFSCVVWKQFTNTNNGVPNSSTTIWSFISTYTWKAKWNYFITFGGCIRYIWNGYHQNLQNYQHHPKIGLPQSYVKPSIQPYEIREIDCSRELFHDEVRWLSWWSMLIFAEGDYLICWRIGSAQRRNLGQVSPIYVLQTRAPFTYIV